MANKKTKTEKVPESISKKYQKRFPQINKTLSEIESNAREKYFRNKKDWIVFFFNNPCRLINQSAEKTLN